jgi:nitrite reductase/ring-hydroxylating ferredoxin subunit
VLLYRERGRVSAIGSVCSHAGGPLEEGKAADGCVTCPWHDSVFRLEDGSIVHGPATRPQPSFKARVRNGQIELRLANDPGAGADRAGRTIVGAPV